MQTDLSGPTLDGRLAGLLREASDKSRREHCPVLASLTQSVSPDDHLALFRASAGVCRDRLVWSQPDSEFSLTGIGAAHVIETAGHARFSDTAAAWNDLCSAGLIESDGPRGP